MHRQMLRAAAGRDRTTFSPDDITGLYQWLKASDIDQSDATAVTSWTARNGLDVSQDTGAAQPTYRTSVIGGQPTVDFDGTDDLLASSTNFGITLTDALTVFAVVRPTGFNLFSPIICQHGNDVKDSMAFSISDHSSVAAGPAAATDHWQPNGTAGSTTLTTNTDYLLTWRTPDWSGHELNTDIWVDGVRETEEHQYNGTGTPSGLVDDVLQIGQFDALSSGFFTGHIAEVLLYTDELSDADRADVENYLIAEYGL